MAQRKDGVADGWILFKGWCERNGGTPIRGGSSADHVCFVGPLPHGEGSTIDPGDPGTVDVAIPESGVLSKFGKERVALESRAAKLQLDEAKLKFDTTTELLKRIEDKAKN